MICSFFNFSAFLSFSVQQFSAFPAAVSSKVLQLLDNGIGVQLFDSLSCLSQPMPWHTPSQRETKNERERERERERAKVTVVNCLKSVKVKCFSGGVSLFCEAVGR